jgi:dipeptidyl-peptidase-4
MLRPPTRVLTLSLLAFASLSAQRKPVTIDDVINAPSTPHGDVVWSPDSEHFVVSEHGEIMLYEAKTGKERSVIALDKLQAAAVQTQPAAVFDWTNRRVGERSIQWFSDAKRLLVTASGDLFVVDIAKGKFEALTQTGDAEHDPKLSPDNRFVSFRRDNDLYQIEVASKVTTRLTTSGSATLLNGRADWVYPEELDLDTAHWWSPDSRYIAYLQFDTSQEPVFPQVSLLNSKGVLEPERYPKAGEPNAEVRLGIVPAEGGETRWMDLGDPRDSLLARVVWAPDSRGVLSEKLNRIQNKLDLLYSEAVTGSSHVVLHEEDAHWINVKAAPKFPPTSNRFLWTSERSGFRHIYLYGLDGKLEKQLTSGDWQVDEVAGVDPARNRVFYTSTEDNPTERSLYAIGLDGSGKQKLSKTAGTHTISFSPNGAYYIDDFSNLTTAPSRTLFRTDSAEAKVLHAPDRLFAEFDILPPEIVQFKTSDGTMLYGRIIKPAGFSATRKYPAVVVVYGGPGAQSIKNTWTGLSWEQALAHKGFVVWQVDNRGSTGRGHKFETPIDRDLGEYELADQQEGIRYLIAQGFVDPQRIGMYGWSYGGYMTLYTVTHAPGLLKAAVAGAPVTSWRNYDSIYTERYMGLPQENPEGYRRSSPQLSANALDGTKLLMIHNIEDDNVHFQNSVQMADALERAGKKFFMLVYPQKSHGVTGPERKNLLEQETAFFEENLR